MAESTYTEKLRLLRVRGRRRGQSGLKLRIGGTASSEGAVRAQNSFEYGHNQKHGEQHGRGDESERDRIQSVIMVILL